MIPVFNEAENIEGLVLEVSLILQGLSSTWELILVDDGSNDETPNLLSRLHSERVRAIRLERNSGQSTALLVGLRASRYNIVATMDGDGQNDPRDLEVLLAQLGPAEMVCGIRANRQDTAWRRFVSKAANRLRSRLTGDGVSDTGCSLKVMTGDVADKLYFFQGAHRFMPALAQLEGYVVTEVPVSHRPRVLGQTKYGNLQRLKATVPDLLGFLWLKSRYSAYHAWEVSGEI